MSPPKKKQQSPQARKVAALEETGALLANLDEQVRIEHLSDRMQELAVSIDRLGDRFEKLDRKFEGKLDGVLVKFENRVEEISERVVKLHLDLTKLEERVGVLQTRGVWVEQILKLSREPYFRAALFLVAGYVAHLLGSTVDVIGIFSKLFGI